MLNGLSYPGQDQVYTSGALMHPGQDPFWLFNGLTHPGQDQVYILRALTHPKQDQLWMFNVLTLPGQNQFYTSRALTCLDVTSFEYAMTLFYLDRTDSTPQEPLQRLKQAQFWMFNGQTLPGLDQSFTSRAMARLDLTSFGYSMAWWPGDKTNSIPQ